VDKRYSDDPLGCLGFGALTTIVVGSGLIGLMFYSSRRGYDDEAFWKRGPKSRSHRRSLGGPVVFIPGPAAAAPLP
jgi:hypothetical protein